MLLLLFTVGYVGFLLVSISFIDAATPLDDRLLSPVQVVGIVLFGSLLGWAVRGGLRMPARVLLAGIVGLVVLANTREAAGWIQEARAEGIGYQSREWRESSLVASMGRIPAGVPVASNGDDIVYFLTGRPMHRVPEKWGYTSRLPNPDYERDVTELCHKLRPEGIMLFVPSKRPYLMGEEEAVQRFALRPLSKDPLGVAYQIRVEDAPACISAQTVRETPD